MTKPLKVAIVVYSVMMVVFYVISRQNYNPYPEVAPFECNGWARILFIDGGTNPKDMKAFTAMMVPLQNEVPQLVTTARWTRVENSAEQFHERALW